MNSQDQDLVTHMSHVAHSIRYDFDRKFYEKNTCLKIGDDYVGTSSYIMSFLSFFHEAIKMADSYHDGKKIIFIADPNLSCCNKKSFEILYENLIFVLNKFDQTNQIRSVDNRFWKFMVDQHDISVQLDYLLLLDMITTKEEMGFFLQKTKFSPNLWVKLMDYTHINPKFSFGEKFCAEIFLELHFVKTCGTDYELAKKAYDYYGIYGAKNQGIISSLLNDRSCHKIVYEPITRLIYDMKIEYDSDWMVFYNPTTYTNRIHSHKDKINQRAFSIEINSDVKIFFLLELRTPNPDPYFTETSCIRRLLQEKLTNEEPIDI